MKPCLRVVAAFSLVLLAQIALAAGSSDLLAGRQTYATFCANCHGTKGDGEGPSARWLSPLPRDFTACKLMRMYPDGDLFKAIKDGGPAALVSFNMPPWKAILTDQQISDVLAYERSFCGVTGLSK
jgi:mono/diheme cytochrome c family protein